MTLVTEPILYSEELSGDNRAEWSFYPGRQKFVCDVAVVREADGFTAYSPNLQGACGQGDTVDEAVADIVDSLKGLVAVYIEQGAIPWEENAVLVEGDVVANLRIDFNA